MRIKKMIINTNNKIIKNFECGTPKRKSFLLEQIRETRDVSLVSSLVDFLEKEKSLLVKERILWVLGRLIPLSELREVDVDGEIDRMRRSPDPFVREGIVEILRHSEL